ncbi:hypothetical protein TH63_09425 [Rufibacter radiotolerans]|uniref:histidine kinase n=1 Tax=Rufibacter radiotolerans TaxID=1379910 RepID=A0A0H4VQ05_9BACT|nr:PAS domain-containing sensor histidine kinase [Rufibacter radiotolerans]AKQ45814.1 hypothetical protein TH63_09425 [Rufibacter radiotolerans]
MGRIEQGDGFLEAILGNSTDLMSIIDAQGQYKYVAGSVKKILGYDPEELVGCNAFSFIHAEDLQGALEALAYAVSADYATLSPFRFRAKDGRWLWLECSVTNMAQHEAVSGYVTNSRDVTERVLEEQRKKKSQAHYEALFHNHPDAVFELNRGGFFTKVNHGVSKLLGFPDGQVLGSHFGKFVHEDDLPLAQNAFANTMSGNTQYLELAIRRGDGVVSDLGITVLPVLVGGEVVSLQGIAKDITAQKRDEAQLKEQVDVVSGIMENIPESFYSLNENWEYTYVNAYYASYMGKKKEELLGRSIWEVFPLATSTRFYRECLQVLGNKTPSFFEEVIPYKADSIISFQIYPAGKGVAVHFVDVTQRKQEKDRLEKMALVASKTTTGIMVMDEERRIEWVNEAFEKSTGFTLEECLMRRPEEVLGGGDAQPGMLKTIKKRLAAGKSFKGEVFSYSKSGRKLWFYNEITPALDDSGSKKIIGVRTDITDRKQKEEEMVRLAQDLSEQNRDLRQFSYIVSHGLRSPAANLIGLANALSTVDRASPDFGRLLGMVGECAHRLDGVILDMNNVLSVKDSRSAPNREQVDLNVFCREVVADFRVDLLGVEPAPRVEFEELPVIYTNKAYLYEILKCLLSNAIKFRRPDVPLHISLKAAIKGKNMELAVVDNGIGMDMGVVEPNLFRLYKKFHRGYAGRGAGLFLSKTYADALGGKIRLESIPSKGTKVSIKFRKDAVCP